MASVYSPKGNLHRHLQGYAGQTLSYEMVKDLMSFVFDMVKDPSVSWVSQDSHIRLLNGVFRKVGQVLDDRNIAAIEESVLTAFVFPGPNDKQAVLNTPAVPPIQPLPKESPAPAPAPKGSNANTLDYETFYRRLHMELVAFENRFTKLAEAAFLGSHEALKRAAMERIELENRLAMEREVYTNLHSNERAEYLGILEMQQAEIQELMSKFLKSQDERTRQADHAFDARMKTLGSIMDATKDQIEILLQEHAQTQGSATQKAGGQLDMRLKNIEQKLSAMDEKTASSRKAIHRISTAAVFGIILTVLGFGAIIYFQYVHP